MVLMLQSEQVIAVWGGKRGSTGYGLQILTNTYICIVIGSYGFT